MRAPYIVERVEWVCLNVLYSVGALLSPTSRAKAVENHLSRISGNFPQPNAHAVIFFACDDAFMERFGYNLILSCYEHARECAVHVHLYEPSPETLRQLELMKQQLRDSDLSYTYERDIDFGSLPERGMYYTAFRFLVARRVVEESKSLLICLDADSLIKHSLQEVIAEARGHDVGLYLRLRKRRVNKKIAAFAVILNHTQGSREFANFFAALSIQFHRRYPRLRSRFYFDQSGLYFSFLLFRILRRASFYHIGKSMIDFEFSDGACIWTAKGRRKDNQVFLRESSRIKGKYRWAQIPTGAPSSAPALAKISS